VKSNLKEKVNSLGKEQIIKINKLFSTMHKPLRFFTMWFAEYKFKTNVIICAKYGSAALPLIFSFFD